MKTLDKITKLGRYFLAIPMVVFGIQHFLYAEFIVNLVPAWIPLRLFWTYFAGLALFAAGVGIIINVWSRLAATLLGLMISIWVVVLHIPRVFEFSGDNEFINVFDAVCMLAGAFLLSANLSEKIYLEKVSVWGAKVSPILLAIALAVFGIEVFIHGKLVFIVGAPYYELPGQHFLIYLTGAVFVAGAAAIAFTKHLRLTSALLGLYILLITILFYTPQLATDIFQAHTWATLLKGMAMGGSVLLLSQLAANKQPSSYLREMVQP
jgi:uncharacterized membrane protein